MNSPGERKDAVWVRVYNFIPFWNEEGEMARLEGTPGEVLEQVRQSCGERPAMEVWSRKIREQGEIPVNHPVAEMMEGLPAAHPLRTLVALAHGFPGQPWIDLELVRWDDGREVAVHKLFARWPGMEKKSA